MEYSEVVTAEYDFCYEIIWVHLTPVCVPSELERDSELPECLYLGRSMIEEDGRLFIRESYSLHDSNNILFLPWFWRSDSDNLKAIHIHERIIHDVYIGGFDDIESLARSEVCFVVPGYKIRPVFAAKTIEGSEKPFEMSIHPIEEIPDYEDSPEILYAFRHMDDLLGEIAADDMPEMDIVYLNDLPSFPYSRQILYIHGVFTEDGIGRIYDTVNARHYYHGDSSPSDGDKGNVYAEHGKYSSDTPTESKYEKCIGEYSEPTRRDIIKPTGESIIVPMGEYR